MGSSIRHPLGSKGQSGLALRAISDKEELCRSEELPAGEDTLWMVLWTYCRTAGGIPSVVPTGSSPHQMFKTTIRCLETSAYREVFGVMTKARGEALASILRTLSRQFLPGHPVPPPTQQGNSWLSLACAAASRGEGGLFLQAEL